MIEVGSLLRMWGNHSKWIALDVIADQVLVVSQKHNRKMWQTKDAFEVIGLVCHNVLTAVKSLAQSVRRWAMSIVWSAVRVMHMKSLSIGRSVPHHFITRVPISMLEACKTHETRAGS